MASDVYGFYSSFWSWIRAGLCDPQNIAEAILSLQRLGYKKCVIYSLVLYSLEKFSHQLWELCLWRGPVGRSQLARVNSVDMWESHLGLIWPQSNLQMTADSVTSWETMNINQSARKPLNSWPIETTEIIEDYYLNIFYYILWKAGLIFINAACKTFSTA